ncbi:MAG TPA: hypothetical protein VFJ17_05500, partial [Mycobacteriales bacterium]|nr:hypothetical protein [Mycobacteriales bacterium]
MATTHEPKYSRREPDATVFAPVIAEFLAAIHIDPELSIAMAKNATAIAWKRAVWDCRRQLRD